MCIHIYFNINPLAEIWFAIILCCSVYVVFSLCCVDGFFCCLKKLFSLMVVPLVQLYSSGVIFKESIP